ncbi:MAG: PIG-L deacetylase family protein [Patescibacteria group bacterium]|jgi:LmbE family N-acetylglucosaminyl deacetylase
MQKMLIIAPHPDDEVLGCGGTIKKYSKAGDEVFLCVVTKAYPPEWSKSFIKNRAKEVVAANNILGIKKTFFLDFPTVKLDTVPQKELNEAILSVIKIVKPRIVYLPHCGDINKDHRLVFEAGLVALRPSNNTSVKRILSYESLSETAEGRSIKEFSPTIYEKIDSEFAKKIQAMKAYKSEIRKFPHPRSLEMMEVLAKKRGSEAGYRLAEAFVLIREIL